MEAHLQASRLSQGGPLTQNAPAMPDAVAAPAEEAAIAVAQALDAEPPMLCLQLDSATQPELLPLQDPTAVVSHPGVLRLESSPSAALHESMLHEGRHSLIDCATPAIHACNSSRGSLQQGVRKTLQTRLVFGLPLMSGIF